MGPTIPHHGHYNLVLHPQAVTHISSKRQKYGNHGKSCTPCKQKCYYFSCLDHISMYSNISVTKVSSQLVEALKYPSLTGVASSPLSASCKLVVTSSCSICWGPRAETSTWRRCQQKFPKFGKPSDDKHYEITSDHTEKQVFAPELDGKTYRRLMEKNIW